MPDKVPYPSIIACGRITDKTKNSFCVKGFCCSSHPACDEQHLHSSSYSSTCESVSGGRTALLVGCLLAVMYGDMGYAVSIHHMLPLANNIWVPTDLW